MEYIYIETEPGKMEDFMELLNDSGIKFDCLPYQTVMIHKMYFILLGNVLLSQNIKSISSKIEGL